jgi:hypothetical protein
MADFPAEGTYGSGGTNALTERSGAAAATDTVPAGSLIVARNTGAGTHTLVLPVAQTVDGLAVTNRTHSMLAGTIKAFRIPGGYGDANGRVAMFVGEASQTEVKYYVIGA